MNKEKLINAEKLFFAQYPGGWEHPEMQAIIKKHKPEKMKKMAQDFFAPECFDNTEEVCTHMVKIITASSMVSVFEKPRFRDAMKIAGEDEKLILCRGLYELLHADKEQGFDMMLDILRQWKMAKWTLMTIIPAYFYPADEVYIKPTTVKGIIQAFDLQGLVYKSAPTFDFYTLYRAELVKMKNIVDPIFHDDNAAFSGFLMMSIGM